MNTLELRHACAQEAALKKYAQAIGGHYQRMVSMPQGALILITATVNERQVNLYCDVDKLLKQCSVDIESLPVEMIDRKLLAGLATRYFSCHELRMPVSQDPVSDFTVTGVVDDTPVAFPLISMDSVEKFIWAELADITLPKLPKKTNAKNWSQLPLHMDIILGCTAISQCEMADLELGDVLIITDCFCNIIVANALAILCKIEEDNMVIDSIEEYNTSYSESSVSLVEASKLSVDNMEIKIDFLLEQKSMTLAELQTLQVNDLLPLQNEGAQINVSLRVGKIVIATGELVRVDDRLAVEILNINGTV
ncbi:FliM/FliN family flagellar motor switch protein [Lelliottia sp. WAP21]|uniref:FliM/FliN family flagellar motor switch protein n=1 Tax=Lelliottia sp. WAP21 TaxID=2877426 RepID=UPI001E4BD5C2|nr:FliM/FliN family flagellar motor switch protein [Lelliottia sp. WAP21]